MSPFELHIFQCDNPSWMSMHAKHVGRSGYVLKRPGSLKPTLPWAARAGILHKFQSVYFAFAHYVLCFRRITLQFTQSMTQNQILVFGRIRNYYIYCYQPQILLRITICIKNNCILSILAIVIVWRKNLIVMQINKHGFVIRLVLAIKSK